MATYREVVCCNNLTMTVENITVWRESLIARVGDDNVRHTRCDVELCLVSLSLDHIGETDLTRMLCDDNGIEWVPLSNEVALAYVVAILII